MLWEYWLSNCADALAITTEQAGIIMSLFLTVLISFVFVLATRSKKIEYVITVVPLFTTILFVYIGWFPTWTGSLLALILTIIVGAMVVK